MGYFYRARFCFEKRSSQYQTSDAVAGSLSAFFCWGVVSNHQEFQVPKMEGLLNLIWGVGKLPYISRFFIQLI